MTLKKNLTSQLMHRAGIASLAVAMTLIILKTLTFFITGSVAILSSLFDSVQDIMTSAINMIAIKRSTEPADKAHRFGHGKAQAIGSLIQAFIIAGAALFLLQESIDRFYQPQALEHVGVGMAIMIITIVLTLLLVHYQSYVVRQTRSLSIRADRAHYTGDIWMNTGVIISMITTRLTGWDRLDAIFGIGVSFYLGSVVFQITKESFDMLMDTEMPEDFRRQIKAIALSFSAVSGIRDLRTRQSGSHTFIQFCVFMADSLTLRQAHTIIDQIEYKIRERFPDTDVIIHPEPERTSS